MKQHLWVLNSSLLAMLVVATLASLLLSQGVPTYQPLEREPETQAPEKADIALEKLYGPRDIFGLFTPPVEKKAEPFEVPTMPVFKAPPPPKAPGYGPLKLTPPLALTLSGIIASSHPDKSVAMIVDDSGKEEIFHIGDSIKDGMLIKVAHDRVVILRNNGQQETLFLRSSPSIFGFEQTEGVPTIARKIEDDIYQIGLSIFQHTFKTLGELVQELALLPFYKDGMVTGLKIGELMDESPITQLGLETDDLITKVDEYDLTDLKARFKAFRHVTSLQPEKSFRIKLIRKGKPLTITYQLAHSLSDPIEGRGGHEEEAILNPQPAQATETQHTEESYQEMINSMRQHLLDNMRSRSHMARVRR